MPPVCMYVCMYVRTRRYVMPMSAYVCVCHCLHLRKAASTLNTGNINLSLRQPCISVRVCVCMLHQRLRLQLRLRLRQHLRLLWRLRVRLCLWMWLRLHQLLRLRQWLYVSHRPGLRLRKGATRVSLVHKEIFIFILSQRKHESLLQARIWPPGPVAGYLETNVKPDSVGIIKNFWTLWRPVSTTTMAM